MEVNHTSNILVIENDQSNFQVRKCIAQALGLLSSIKLIHAKDVKTGLSMLEKNKFSAIIYSEEDCTEKDSLIQKLGDFHPPLVIQTEDSDYYKHKQSLDQNIMYVPIYDTLEGMHQVLILAATLGGKKTKETTEVLEFH